MKASLKLREGSKLPLVRAKIPVGILGLPFVSGISGGDPGDLSFSLQTAWIPSLSLKLTCKPNDSLDPFVFAVKSAIGPWNSPEKSSAMTMAAEFSLLRRGNPCFFLHIKPELGNFSARKSISSQTRGNPRDPVRTVDAVDPANQKENGGFSAFSDQLGDFPVENLLQLTESPENSVASPGMQELFSGTTVRARTNLPVRKNASLKIRWGVNFPVELPVGNDGNRHGFCGAKLPFLTVDKISFENSLPAADDSVSLGKEKERQSPESNAMLNTMMHELEALQRESSTIRESIRELKSRIEKDNDSNLPGLKFPDTDCAPNRNGATVNGLRDRKPPENPHRSGSSNPTVADVSEELRRAIRGASGT